MILTDKDAFCEHIRLCENAMYSLAFSIVRNGSDAGEIISESIYRAYKNLDTLKNENSFESTQNSTLEYLQSLLLSQRRVCYSSFASIREKK